MHTHTQTPKGTHTHRHLDVDQGCNRTTILARSPSWRIWLGWGEMVSPTTHFTSECRAYLQLVPQPPQAFLKSGSGTVTLGTTQPMEAASLCSVKDAVYNSPHTFNEVSSLSMHTIMRACQSSAGTCSSLCVLHSAVFMCCIPSSSPPNKVRLVKPLN